MNNAEIISKFKERNLHCGELIKRINESLSKHANNVIQSTGITFTQLKLLIVLFLADSSDPTLKELEKFFGAAQSTTAGIVSRLEKKGFVRCYTDANDKRIKHVQITDKGRECCISSKENIDAGEKFLLSPLTGDEQRLFMGFLQKIYDNLNTVKD